MNFTNFYFSLIIFTSCTLFSCTDSNSLDPDYVIGKNYFQTDVDGDMREYYVHVPEFYDENEPTPVVFMLHGTSGNGLKFYNISGWKEVGEDENILTVYPSSWEYCIIDEGKTKMTTKWNIFPASWTYCEQEKPRDDIKFLRQIVSELGDRFNVNGQKIYIVGFSNGGAMAFRCAVEMNDIFAAAVESGGSYSQETFFNPDEKIPVTFQLGNRDPKWFGEGITFPIGQIDTLMQVAFFKRLVTAHNETFDCGPDYTLFGDELHALGASYPGTKDNEFNFVLINDLAHNYPNTKNHPLNGALLNWEWLNQFEKM